MIIFPSPSLIGTGWDSTGRAKNSAVQLNIWCEAPELITSMVERCDSGDSADDNKVTDLRRVCALGFASQSDCAVVVSGGRGDSSCQEVAIFACAMRTSCHGSSLDDDKIASNQAESILHPATRSLQNVGYSADKFVDGLTL